MKTRPLIAFVPLLMLSMAHAQARSSAANTWHAATPAQLESALPARALVEKERIETEMPSASGIVDGHGRVIAAVVLITAGYAAHGKYTHYLLAQAHLRLGSDLELPPGAYVVGWERIADGLQVHVYEAETGKERGTLVAHPQTQPSPVVPVKVWPPSDRSVIQIGRFILPYTPLD
jgi:hypothetical protein